MAMYIDMNDGIIPAQNRNLSGLSSWSGKWQDMLMQLYSPGIELTDYCYVKGYSDGTSMPKGPFACPSSVRWDNTKGTRHYAINSAGYASNVDCVKKAKATRIKRPSARMAICDIDYPTTGYQDPTVSSRSVLVNAPDGVWRHLNNSGANFGFADGHVEGGRIRPFRPIPPPQTATAISGPKPENCGTNWRNHDRYHFKADPESLIPGLFFCPAFLCRSGTAAETKRQNSKKIIKKTIPACF